MRAFLNPLKKNQSRVEVELLGRVGNNKIKVDTGTKVFAVDRFRLYELEARPGFARDRIAADILDGLEWKGAGKDPLERAQATPSGAAKKAEASR